MSRRQRRARESSLRQRVAREKVLRRRARESRARPAAVATVAALTLAGLAPAASSDASNIRAAAPRLLSACTTDTEPSYPLSLTRVGGTTFFSADDGVHGRELWKSDGTKAGTVLVKDIQPKRGRGYPNDLVAVGGTLFFAADDGVHGRELWKSDGTTGGTVMVKDISSDKSSYRNSPKNLTDVGGELYFTVGQALWKSDGTRGGTVLVKEIGSDDSYYGPDELTAVGTRLFFRADDGVHGRELWRSDGTGSGTVMVKDVTPPDTTGYSYGPQSLTVVGGTLFFSDDDGAHGQELWKTDGTKAGTVMVEDIHPGGYDSEANQLTDVGGTLFFTARDGVHGSELWESDGTAAGTKMVKDINPNAKGNRPTLLSPVGQRVFFTADDGVHGSELWKSDGTAAGTVLVKDIQPGPGGSSVYAYGSSRAAVLGGRLFFAADDGVHGRELWRSNGTQSGTVLVKDIDSSSEGYSYGPQYLTPVGTRLVFSADDGPHGAELWRSNGTAAGTTLVEDINRAGVFTVDRRGTANLKKGTLRVKASLTGAGTLVVKSAGDRLIRRVARHLDAAGSTHVTLRPTAKGMRELRQALKQAHRHGDKVGELMVRARFKYVPCGGTTNTQVRRYTLKLR